MSDRPPPPPSPTPKPKPQANWKRSILAGGLAGGIEICLTMPTEYVKTQLQLDSGASGGARYRGPLHCARATVAESGVLGLYRGLTPLLAGSIPKAAVRFAAMDKLRAALTAADGTIAPERTFVAGLGAGACEAALVVCPMETIKTKLIHDMRRAQPRYRGLAHGVSSIVKAEGFAGIYQGLAPTIAKQASNQAVRFTVFGECRAAFLGRATAADQTVKLPVWQSMVSGAVAGAASVAANNPLDVIKSQMQGLDASRFRSSWHCAQTVWASDGVRGFYKGVSPRLARVTADVALVMTLYDQIMSVLVQYRVGGD